MFITAILQAFALPVLTAAGFMQLLDRDAADTGFFMPGGPGRQQRRPDRCGGGQPLLWQHLFWFYSHPAVYIMILPAMGMVSRHARLHAPQADLRLQADGLLDGGDRRPGLHRLGPPHVHLGHEPGARHDVHGLDDDDRAALGHQDVQLARHDLGRPHPVHDADAELASAFVSMFIIGGLSGIFMAATPVDIYIHDTYFIVAHFHYVLFAGDAVRRLRRRSTSGSRRCSAG